MNDLDRKLNEVLGASFNWMQYISSIAVNQARNFSKSGLIDDIVTDVVSDIVVQAEAKEGGLALALIRAKEASADDESLLRNVKGVVMQAAKFRVSDARRKWQRFLKTPQFSQLDSDGESGINAVVDEHRDASEYESYKPLLVNELQLMAQAAEWKRQTKLARRLRLAAEVVPFRLDGETMGELMERFEVKSTATMQAILDDIGQALARVAARTGNPVLMAGTESVAI